MPLVYIRASANPSLPEKVEPKSTSSLLQHSLDKAKQFTSGRSSPADGKSQLSAPILRRDARAGWERLLLPRRASSVEYAQRTRIKHSGNELGSVYFGGSEDHPLLNLASRGSFITPGDCLLLPELASRALPVNSCARQSTRLRTNQVLLHKQNPLAKSRDDGKSASLGAAARLISLSRHITRGGGRGSR